jgi:hypothetical protein
VKHRRLVDVRPATRGIDAAAPAARGLVLALALAIAVLTPVGDPDVIQRTGRRAAADDVTPTPAQRVCDTIGREAAVRTWRGLDGTRSGDILMIPDEPNFVNGGLTHATPFDYTQQVPLFLYGPGYIVPGVYEEPVTLADIAPTTGALLDFEFETPDGVAQTAALVPEAERPVPALVLTLIWDSVGDNVLERWPDAWPTLRSLMPQGAWFENTTVGASPSNTPVAHATIGTGTFPRRHGLVDVYIRVGDEIQEPNELGPGTLREPTLADRYDIALGNAPIVGGIGTLADHLMMMSHGTDWLGGDRDIAITREDPRGETTGVESTEWNLTEAMAPYYEFPSYVNDLPPVETYVEEVDRADGVQDGLWRENDIAQLGGGFDTPARAPYEQTMVETLIETEGFGVDEVPDLLYVNFKATDKIGHLFSADGIEMADTLASQDAALARLIDYLDSSVGAGRWVLVLAADHGTQNDPALTGAHMIDADKLRALVSARFDDDGDEVPVIQKLRPSQIWLDVEELAQNGHTTDELAAWMNGLTFGRTFIGATPPPPDEADDLVFAAVLPTTDFAALPCLPREARTE